VDAAVIEATLGIQHAPQAACERLIESALEAGGADNITVVVCDVRSVCTPEPAARTHSA
jgi:serine/threonine protein phosphatase PrpC